MNKQFQTSCYWFFLLFFLPACAGSSWSAKTTSPQKITILGLGDSITEGGPGFDSYLFPLDSMLKAAGYPVVFTGPRQTTRNNKTLHHAGFSGKTAEYIAKQIDSIYTAFPADIVLLHSGHNHFAEEQPVKGIIAAQNKIIDVITQKNPDAIIFVAAVITSGKLPKYSYIPRLNREIKNMVISRRNSRIIFVNQQKDWDWTRYTISDNVHPNAAGAIHIAKNWFTAIKKHKN
ncbi:GDSL-type esterase/lipase family protein [Niabella drilacis]|uniref:Lysophospholipase L1 n=1 Tax=Niabella drilacis (strain DSM 25811 / CCM 8410 / CCUG 62505 / LMG 26954 / E90) TaxID=1285928 RepID=A0A1G6XJD2_NIADE|nr:GDSL-type esterase/lipase family protein [Niabella drilacis]SDD78280.1 Lysophospholipase L1 [Niabella drilacis]